MKKILSIVKAILRLKQKKVARLQLHVITETRRLNVITETRHGSQTLIVVSPEESKQDAVVNNKTVLLYDESTRELKVLFKDDLN